MENRVSLPLAGIGKVKKTVTAPWVAFYLASSLGLMLGALSDSLAQTHAPDTRANDFAILELSGNDSSTTNSPAQGQVNIPGIPSAVLTVGKEIQTNVPMINLDDQKNTGKKATQSPTAASNAKPKYYLELPASKTKTARQAAFPEVANSIPIAATIENTAPTTENTGIEMTSPAEQSSLAPADPETQPLELNESGPVSSGTATSLMIRVTLGLMAVLGMLLLFSRKVLPGLMNRHPEFFENLKQKSEQKPLEIPQSMAEKLARKKPPRKQNLLTTCNETAQALQAPGNVELSGKQFNVLSSTALSKDKDLHLVEIMGRQLVVATTPYTVSLIQDLSSVQPERAEGEEPPEAQTTQLNLLDNPNLLALSSIMQPEMADSQESGEIAAHWEPLEATIPQADSITPEASIETALETPETFLSYQEALDAIIPEGEHIIIVEDLDDQPPEIQES